MKLLATRKAEQNEAAIDPWTVVHFAAGLAFGLMDLPLRPSVGLALLYEGVEQFVERRPWGQKLFHTHRPESIPNSIVDMLVIYVGHRLGATWNDTA